MACALLMRGSAGCGGGSGSGSAVRSERPTVTLEPEQRCDVFHLHSSSFSEQVLVEEHLITHDGLVDNRVLQIVVFDTCDLKKL